MANQSQETNPPQEHPNPDNIVFPPRSLDPILGTGRPRKTSWPEVVGLAAEEAEKKIKEEMPGARIPVVPLGCFVTMDFNQQRVRLYVDPSGKVAKTPNIG
ncbi:hypothetical protein NMG60_11005379 [Bertholletia excelsa]